MQAQLPLSALLSKALIAIALEYEQAGAGSSGVPTLEMRSNLLRCFEGGSVPEAVLPALTRLSRRAVRARVGRAQRGDTVSDLTLSAVLSQALVAYTMEYEAKARVPLALNVNVLQWLDPDRGRPLSTVPARGAVGALERHGLVQTFSAEDGGGGLWVRLTDRGRRARVDYGQRIKLIDQQWQARYGPELRTALEAVVDGLDLPCHPIGAFVLVGGVS